jgi:hypothetical protein
MPEGIRRDQFLAWVEQLEDRTTPDWLGLPNNAERVLLANRGGWVSCQSLPSFSETEFFSLLHAVKGK